jgi:poly-beta-1,6-N-acetyl-D-glucosamine biosynthesis protein PgaD
MNNPLIIEKPEGQGKLKRAVSFVVTLLLWFVWLSLWLPLCELIVRYTTQMPSFEATYLLPNSNILPEINFMSVLIMGLLAILVSVGIQRLQLTKLNRRKRNHLVSIREIGVYYQIPSAYIHYYQDIHCVSVCFDQNGRVIELLALTS